MREAFRLAEEERPGAVHLELPEDITAEGTDAVPLKKSSVRRPVGEEKALQKAVEMIQNCKHPLLVIGAGANRKLTCRVLNRLIEKQGIPFITTQMGKGVNNEDHPLFLGNAALSANDFMHRAIERADLIINIGHDVVEKPPFFMKRGGTRVIHVNFNTASVDPVYFPQVEIVGDIAHSIWEINERISPQECWDFSYYRRVSEAMSKNMCEGAHDDRFPVYPQRLVADVRKVMPDDGIITLDNGVYKIWFARNYRARQPNTVLLDNALATMGTGLPSAMAARLVYPDRKVGHLRGRGVHDEFPGIGNRHTAENEPRGPHLVLILNDSAYGMIKWKQANMGFKNWGLDYGNPDFVKYAESYGAIGHRVNSAEELLTTLQSCLSTEGVHLIDIPVDYSENDRILNREIAQKSKLI